MSALYQQVTTRQQLTDAKAFETQDTKNTNDPQKKYPLGMVSKNILPEGLDQFHGVNPFKRKGLSNFKNWRAYFDFKGFGVVLFIFIQILIEHSVSEQWRS